VITRTAPRGPQQIVYTAQRSPRGIAYRARIGDVNVRPYGCMGWPACVAGGTLCPDPNGFGASFNFCCGKVPPTGPCPDDVPQAANSDGSYGLVGSAADAIGTAATTAVTSVPSWVWIIGILGGLVVLKGVRG
jgi:hypothetical protein